MLDSVARTHCSGEADTTPFSELEARTLRWMRSFRIPEEYRVELAQTLLRGASLYRWHDRENWVGHERGWFVFQTTMIATFHVVDDMTTWTRTAERFRQCLGEIIRSYFDRFDSR